MKRSAGTILLAVVLAAGCGNDEAEHPDPEVARRLGECQSALQRAETATEMCTKQLDGKGTGGGEWVLRVEGDTVTVSGRSRPQVGDDNISAAQAAQLTEQFNEQVRKSRGAIQQCYVAALKKNESIQARPIQLTVTVLVTSSGAITQPSFSPHVSSDFTSCMTGVAKRWKLSKYTGGAIRLQYPVTLTPT